jgi:hypothetical protein
MVSLQNCTGRLFLSQWLFFSLQFVSMSTPGEQKSLTPSFCIVARNTLHPWHVTCFMSPFWRPEFCGGSSRFLEALWTPTVSTHTSINYTCNLFDTHICIYILYLFTYSDFPAYTFQFFILCQYSCTRCQTHTNECEKWCRIAEE